MESNQPIQLLSVTEVARALSCSRGHIYDLIAAGHFRPVDIGAKSKSKMRIRDCDLQAFIANRSE